MTALDTIKQAILGVPYDPNLRPDRVKTVQAFAEMQVQLEGAQAGAYVRSTVTSLNGLLIAPNGAMAYVVRDPITANNGIYQNVGTSTAAVWERRTDIPQFVVTGINVGAGTANAIQITTDLPVPSQDGRALILVPILATNTVSPPTVSINGGAAIPIVTNSGNNVVVNGLSENSYIAGFVVNGKFRLLSDQASAAVLAGAEDAADRAEAAAGALAMAPVRPEAFGALHDGSDDKAAIEAAFAFATANNRAVAFANGRTYSFSSLVIPDNTVIFAEGATLRYLGTLPNFLDISLDIGENCVIDELIYSTPGTEANAYGIYIGDGSKINYIEAISDVARPNSFMESKGQDIWIGYIKTVNIDRPVHINASNIATTSGSYIGFLDVENFLRGIRYTNHNAFVLGGHHIRGRSTNAPPEAVPGYNGILLSGCGGGYYIGDGVVESSAEHGYRIGGNDLGGASIGGTFGNLTAIKTRGCAFKVNPLGGADLVVDITIASITGIDCGEGTSGELGKQPDFIRLTNVRNIRIGWGACTNRDYTTSCLAGITLNDVDGVYVGGLRVDNAGGSMLAMDQDRDNPDGPVNNVYIGSLVGSCKGANAISFNLPGHSYSNIFVNNIDFGGFTTRFIAFVTPVTVNGTIFFSGQVRGAVAPVINNAPAANSCIIDLKYGLNRFYGRMDHYRDGAGFFQVSSGDFTITDQKPCGLYVNAATTTAGSGAYGGALELSRAGGGRRGGAVVVKQITANAYQTGLAFMCGNPGINGSDAVVERAVLDHAGNLSIVGALSKGSGTFDIEHPTLDGKRLIHGFVEAPRYDLIYRGKVKLKKGKAVVNIDEASNMTAGTFDALVQNAEVVSLNNLESFARVKSKEVSKGKFEILCENEKSEDVITWVVMAERADKFIIERDPWTDDDGRLITEHEKKGD